MQNNAKITSKGQVTIPVKVRRALGVKEGDKLVFEQKGTEVVVRPLKNRSAFAKYRGIGNKGLPSGRKAVVRATRDLRDAE